MPRGPRAESATRLTFTRRADERLSDVADQIALRFATPCGDYDVPYQLSEGELPELRREEDSELDPERSHGVAIFANVYPREPIKKVSVWVDNKGGPARSVEVGEMKSKVPADKSVELAFPITGRCTGEVYVRVDGTSIGRLTPTTTHVIDPTGEVCYEAGSRSYSTSSFAATPGMGPTKRFIAPARIHDVKRVDFVLQPAPYSIEMPGAMPSATRLYFTRATPAEAGRCAGVKKQ